MKPDNDTSEAAEIAITPEMIEAGSDLLASYLGDLRTSPALERELLAKLYMIPLLAFHRATLRSKF